MKVLCPLVSSPVVTDESKGGFKQGQIYRLTFLQVRGGEVEKGRAGSVLSGGFIRESAFSLLLQGPLRWHWLAHCNPLITRPFVYTCEETTTIFIYSQ